MIPIRSRYFRMSLTSRCNMACIFCHNEGQGPINNRSLSYLDAASITWISKIAFNAGFRKFKLTGGEPLTRPDIFEIIRGIRSVGIQDLSMITNGVNLSRMAYSLRDAGLQRINVSLHSLDPLRFRTEFGSQPSLISKIVNGIDQAISVGFTDMKINCVYGGPHPEHDLDTMLDFTSHRSLTLVLLPELAFGAAKHNKEVSLDDLYEILKRKKIKKEELIVDGEGLRKRFITMHNGAHVLLRLDELRGKFPYPACSNCQKISICREGIFPVRLTAKGNLRPCLADGLPEVNLSHIIETQDEESLLQEFKNLGK